MAANGEEKTETNNGEGGVAAETETVEVKTETETTEPVERTEAHAKLLEYGIIDSVANELDEIYKTGLMQHEDLDQRALDALKECNEEKGLAVLDQFKKSDLFHVGNKSAYLCGVMKAYRMKAHMPSTERKGPDETKLNEILERTGYKLDITTGQRKYGPPPGCEESASPGCAGHEVFCGKIPRDLFEDELIPLFEKCGKIWDLRLMLDHTTGLNRGFCFVTYCDKEGAQEAVKQLDNHEIKKGHAIKVNLSVANTRLYIGNIPKDKEKEEILEEFKKLVGLIDGVTDVIIYPSSEDKKKNRGFAFLDFDNHKSASAAKKKITYHRKVWNCDVTVDWADTQEEPDEETMEKVKVLYIKNLSAEVTEEMLKETFSEYGKLERVKKLKDCGFAHFEEREDALKAMEALNGTEIGANKVEIALAKPQAKAAQRRKKMRMMMNARGRYYWYDYCDDYYFYGPPPPPPMRGRGGPRGMGRGGRGLGGGGGGFRGRPFRGGATGGNGGGGGMMRPWGGKRKFGGEHGGGPPAGGKRGNWGAHPIAQQPLRGGFNNYYAGSGGGDDQWYQDTYGDNW
ncbi:heterogeneous nuclear ribonucleoprotein Q-like [Tubulanus polymorphus]|uniref:heterogeneous nuclear ribonucleoprotein Q-like n=1 Tax=Tubulanus polymorphus TaxID=672921 RepID=UPI003DA6B56C